MVRMLRAAGVVFLFGSVFTQGCSLIVEDVLNDLDGNDASVSDGSADSDGKDSDVEDGANTDAGRDSGVDARTDATDISCANKECGPNQHCVEVSGEARCECDEGYTGVDCSNCAPGYQDNDEDGECKPDCGSANLDCGDREICTDESGTARCECEIGYRGDACDECASGYQDHDDDGVCEPDCDTAPITCQEHAHCEDDSGEAQCVCDPRYEGDDCASCADGYQDNDDNNTCEPDCDTMDLDCSDHGSCDDSSGEAICVCDPTFVGDNCETCAVGFKMQNDICEWTGVVENGGFDDDTAWTVEGNATIEGGWGRFDTEASCLQGTISQSVSLPEYVHTGRLLLRFDVRRSDVGAAPSIGVGIDGQWQLVFLRTTNTFEEHIICLGDRLYGKTIDIEFGRYVRLSACDSTVVADFYVDNVQIEPALADECPEQGSIANSDFEQGDDGAWVAEQTGDGVAEVRAGTQMNEEYYGYFNAEYQYDSARLIGTMFTPESTSVENSAIEILFWGTAGRSMNLLLDEVSVGQMVATGANEFIRICLPDGARGRVYQPKFEMPSTGGSGVVVDAREFRIDDLTFVSDSRCPEGAHIVDGGFELDTSEVVSPWNFDKYTNNSTNPDIDISVLEEGSLAHSGSHVLRLQAVQRCTWVSATAAIFVPEPDGDAGPVIQAHYRLPSNIVGEFTLCIRGGAEPSTEIECHIFAESPEYTEMSLCIDPSLAGRTLEVELKAYGGSGSCVETYAVERLFIDDITVTTDESCPL